MKKLPLFIAIILAPRFALAEPEAQPVPPPPPPVVELPVAFGWNADKQSHYPTSIAVSARGEIWVGTEDKGVWRYSPTEKTWTGFTSADGLGDDSVYAVAVDKLGRVWAGHLNHGVSVYNGEKWRNYTSLDGPLGDRVFAIATCPSDGDVWIATDCGLARYSLKKDDWDYYTRAAGLPSNQIQAIAFDPDGNIVVGTQCNGLALAQRADEYRAWRLVQGPRRPSNTPFGENLPSNQINGVFIESDNSIDVATPWGIASTGPTGNWFFIRGQDWGKNARGLFEGIEPVDESPPDVKLMLEDWITALDEHNGRVFAGTREQGFEIRNAENGEAARYGTWPSQVPCAWIRAFLSGPAIPSLVAIYDNKTGGLKTLDPTKAIKVNEKDNEAKSAPFPTPAKAVDAKSLQSIADYLGKLKLTLKPGEGYFLGDDWRTQGDWVGRYGRTYAKLFGMNKTTDHEYSADEKYRLTVEIGPHTGGNETKPYTYVAHDETENPRVLYYPETGKRREAEINDGSWQAKLYSPEWEGPDLIVHANVPDGLHRISLYFHNNDAHANSGRGIFRDFDLELWPGGKQPFYDPTAEPLARARVTDFIGGVYKQFVVSGPGEFQIRIGRSRSFSTKLQGAFIDPLGGETRSASLPGFEDARYEAPSSKAVSAEAGSPLDAAVKLWDELNKSWTQPGAAGLEIPFRILAYRTAAAGNAPPELLANWRWQLQFWTSKDREEFKTAMERAWKAHTAKHPEAANQKPEK